MGSHDRQWIALTLILLGGLALRLWILGAQPHVEADGYYYIKIAENFRAGGPAFHPLFHPIYPALIAGAQSLISDAERAARLVSVVTGALTVLPAAFLAGRLFGRRVALGTALLVAVHPLLVLSSTYVLTEATYALLITTAAAMTIWARDERAGWPLPVVGLLLGAAYLARPEGLLLVPILFGWWIASRLGDRLRRSAAMAWAALGIAAVLLVALPYLFYLHSALGVWTLSGKVGHNLALDSGAATDFGGILSQASGIAWRYARNLLVVDKYTLPALFPPALMFLLAFGLFGARANTRDRHEVAFLLSLGLPTIVVPFFHIETRVFVPYLPGALILAARGACWLGERLGSGGAGISRRLGDAWLTWAALVFVSIVALPYALRPRLLPEPREWVYREAAAWITDHASDIRRIMDRKPYIAYYSGRAFEPIPPRGDVSTITALARQHRVDLLVIDVELVQGDRPDIQQLAFPALAPQGLELLRVYQFPNAPPLLLYRLNLP